MTFLRHATEFSDHLFEVHYIQLQLLVLAFHRLPYKLQSLIIYILDKGMLTDTKNLWEYASR